MVNRRVIESLIHAGSFDSIEKSRAKLLAGLDACLELAQRIQDEKASGQIALFGGAETEESIIFPEVKDYALREKLALEKGVLGFYLTGHPLDAFKSQLKQKVTAEIAEMETLLDSQRVIIGGLILSVKRLITKKGDTMAAITLEDLTGQIEIIVFPQLFAKYWRELTEDNIVLILGKLNNQEELKIIAEDIMLPGKADEKLYIRFKDTEQAKAGIPALYKLLAKHKGNSPVIIFLEKENKIRKLDASLWVNLSSELLRAVELLFGKECYKLG